MTVPPDDLIAAVQSVMSQLYDAASHCSSYIIQRIQEQV